MIHHGDCIEAMAAMEPESVDAIVTDPPYGLEFMGKEWDRLDWNGPRSMVTTEKAPPTFVHDGRPAVDGKPRGKAGATKQSPYEGKPRWGTVTPGGWQRMQAWHQQWAEAAYRVAKPSAYLLAFGGTRTVHRMTVALEDAGWIIRDMLVWAYASGFPKSKASLKPAWEPIVMARKPGPLRDLAIDACRIPTSAEDAVSQLRANTPGAGRYRATASQVYGGGDGLPSAERDHDPSLGRWPANVILTDPIFDGGVEGVVGGGETAGGGSVLTETSGSDGTRSLGAGIGRYVVPKELDRDSGTYSRFFLIPKSSRDDREPVLRPAGCICETVKLRAWTSGTSPLRATSEETQEDGSDSSTMWSGSTLTDPSPRDLRSTTSTATSGTTPSTTLLPSTPSPTNGSTPAANFGMEPGGSNATSAGSGSRSTLSTSTSAARDGRSTVGADPATSASSSRRSVCAECGKEVVPSSGARINAHPT